MSKQGYLTDSNSGSDNQDSEEEENKQEQELEQQKSQYFNDTENSIDDDLTLSQENLEKQTKQIVLEAIKDIQDNCFSEKDRFYLIQDEHQFYHSGKVIKIKYFSIKPKLNPYDNLKRYLHAGIVYMFSKGEEKFEQEEQLTWKEIKYHSEYFEDREHKLCSNCQLGYKEIVKECKDLAKKRAQFIKYLDKNKKVQKQQLEDSQYHQQITEKNVSFF